MFTFFSMFTSLMLLTGITFAELPVSEPTSVIWGAKVSPFVRKVLVAMEYKEIPYQNQDLLPSVILLAINQEIPEGFSNISPLGKIPAFQQGDFSIADSSVIIAYLEKRHPEHPLYPQNPQLLARSLWLEKYGDTVLSAVTHTLIIESLINPLLKVPTDKVAIQNAIEQELPPALDYLEKQLQAPWAGRFFIGNELTVADIGVSTHLISLKLLLVEIDAKRWPLLSAYLQRILNEPSFKKVL
ncbi:MAG: glutathione S-transferase family protein [Parachlamydiaceae bacterium]|nr:glutathione S-transferase family protein [Parachlamydiaceae bacterium]